MEDRKVRIPYDKAIRADLRAVTKVTTMSGNIRFTAERTKDGHSDRFWALALGIHAAGTGSEARWKPLTKPASEKPKVNNKDLNVLAYVAATGGNATVEQFHEDQAPVGPMLLARLSILELVWIDKNGKVQLTSAGMLALAQSYDNNIDENWTPA
jgi:hypothetical protein